jgi:hypothetical protein
MRHCSMRLAHEVAVIRRHGVAEIRGVERGALESGDEQLHDQ